MKVGGGFKAISRALSLGLRATLQRMGSSGDMRDRFGTDPARVGTIVFGQKRWKRGVRQGAERVEKGLLCADEEQRVVQRGGPSVASRWLLARNEGHGPCLVRPDGSPSSIAANPLSKVRFPIGRLALSPVIVLSRCREKGRFPRAMRRERFRGPWSWVTRRRQTGRRGRAGERLSAGGRL
jgi:hypothetical protein